MACSMIDRISARVVAVEELWLGWLQLKKGNKDKFADGDRDAKVAAKKAKAGADAAAKPGVPGSPE